MRKSEYLKQQVALTPNVIFERKYIPEIAKTWVEYGYNPNYLLDENDNFYNILEDYFKTKKELKADGQTYGKYNIAHYCFQREEDMRIYKKLFDLIKNSFCGFYDVRKKRYFKSSEIYPYAEWYLYMMGRGRDYYGLDKPVKGFADHSFEEKIYDTLCDKYSAFFNNIAALFIATDVTQYLEEKSICDKSINKNNVDLFLRYGPKAGYIFDAEKMEYRKPKNFKDFAYDLHTRYWFHDPRKGYHIDAPYKWAPDAPTPEELEG